MSEETQAKQTEAKADPTSNKTNLDNPNDPKYAIPEGANVDRENNDSAEIQREVANWAAANEPS